MPLLPLPAFGDLIVALGDSITADFPDLGQPDNAWFKGTGGLLDLLGVRIRAANPGATAATLSRLAAVRLASVKNPASPLSVVNQGVGGSNIADINVATMVAPFAPKYVFLATGVNDAYEGITPASFETSYTAVLNALFALKPRPYVLCLNILCFGEQWQYTNGVPAWGPNPLDATILDMNTRLATLAAGYSNVALVDQRAKLLEWEAQFNAPAPGRVTGKFCYDSVAQPPFTGAYGVHPRQGGAAAGGIDLRRYQGQWAMEAFA